jgi:hypothetical protein
LTWYFHLERSLFIKTLWHCYSTLLFLAYASDQKWWGEEKKHPTSPHCCYHTHTIQLLTFNFPFYYLLNIG